MEFGVITDFCAITTGWSAAAEEITEYTQHPQAEVERGAETTMWILLCAECSLSGNVPSSLSFFFLFHISPTCHPIQTGRMISTKEESKDADGHSGV